MVCKVKTFYQLLYFNIILFGSLASYYTTCLLKFLRREHGPWPDNFRIANDTPPQPHPSLPYSCVGVNFSILIILTTANTRLALTWSKKLRGSTLYKLSGSNDHVKRKHNRNVTESLCCSIAIINNKRTKGRN